MYNSLINMGRQVRPASLNHHTHVFHRNRKGNWILVTLFLRKKSVLKSTSQKQEWRESLVRQITAFSSFNFAPLLCQEKQEGTGASKNWSGIKMYFPQTSLELIHRACVHPNVCTPEPDPLFNNNTTHTHTNQQPWLFDKQHTAFKWLYTMHKGLYYIAYHAINR